MDVAVLSTANPLTKSKLFHLAYAKRRKKCLPVGVSDAPLAPARSSPTKPPLLVSPKEISPPKTSGLPLNGYMLHNLAHVELKAIDLAWDTVTAQHESQGSPTRVYSRYTHGRFKRKD